MNDLVEEVRTLRLDWKIVTSRDLQRIAAAIERTSTQDQADDVNARAELSFRIKCEDGSAYKSHSSAVFLDDSAASAKRLTSVSMYYSLWRSSAGSSSWNSKEVDVRIYHGDSASSEISISGTERVWVNGFMAEIRDAVDAMQPQDMFLQRRRNLILVTSSVLVAFAVLGLMMALFSSAEVERTRLTSAAGILELGALFAGTLGAAWGAISLLLIRLNKLFPRVELQVGPEHTLVEEHNRRRLAKIFAELVLPIVPGVIVSALFLLIK